MKGLVKILLIILSILYVVSPYDLISDFVPVAGWLDDALALGAVIYYLKRGKLPAFFSSTRGASRAGASYGDKTRRRQAFEHEDETVNADSRVRGDAKDPYEILGISSGATLKEIHEAYRQAAQRYHPDKVSHLGQEFQDLAQKKFVEIQKAYELLIKKHG